MSKTEQRNSIEYDSIQTEQNNAFELGIISAESFIQQMFPHVDKHIPSLMAKTIVAIQEHAIIDPFRDNIPGCFAYLRGSTGKRAIMGTPEHYWDVSHLARMNQQINPDDAKTLDLMKSFSQGPFDVDIRYVGNAADSFDKARLSILETYTSLGFAVKPSPNKNIVLTRPDGVDIEIVERKFGDDAHPIKLFNIKFSKNGVFQINLDLGDLGDVENNSDIRIKALMSSRLDFISIGDVVNSPDHTVNFRMNGLDYKKQYHWGEWTHLTHSLYPGEEKEDVLSSRSNVVRQVVDKIIWLPDKKYLHYKEGGPIPLIDVVDTKEIRSWYRRFQHNLTDSEKKKLQERGHLMMKDLALGFIYNPLLFMAFAARYNGKPFEGTQLGNLVHTHRDRVKLLTSMSAILGFSVSDSIEEVSQRYQERFLSSADADIQRTGLTALITGLKQMGKLDTSYPETVEGALKLLEQQCN